MAERIILYSENCDIAQLNHKTDLINVNELKSVLTKCDPIDLIIKTNQYYQEVILVFTELVSAVSDRFYEQAAFINHILFYSTIINIHQR